MSAKKNFKIVQLSDLHLTDNDNDKRTEVNLFSPLTGMNEAFRKVINSKLVQGADLVVISGDITDKGTIKSWENFWNEIDNAGCNSKLFLVPGNHDVCCLGARLPYKNKAYKNKDLEKAVRGFSIGGHLCKFPSVCQPSENIVLFGLNSNNLGNFNVASNAMGELDYYQLKGLASKIHRYKDVPVKIFVLHHSPNIPEKKTAKRRGQKPMSKLARIGHQIPQAHRRALILLAVTHRVRLILHGHLHMQEDRKISGVRIIGAPSSTEPILKNGENKYPVYNYTIYGKSNTVRTNFSYV